VEPVDFVSGLGPRRARELGGTLPRYNQIRFVVTDLGVFDFGGAGDAMRLVSIHRGVAVEEVIKKTGFPVEIPERPPETRHPSDDELRLIRDAIDPHGLRLKEVSA
jgi:acyl CoA:acetate/3-ketoacid CoA transferase beta subunit